MLPRRHLCRCWQHITVIQPKLRRLVQFPEYFVPLEAHRGKTLGEFADLLRALPKKPVGTVQLAELCSMPQHPNGLYFFYDDNDDLWYIGKSTGRSFIERIPSHFDQRPDAWFNTLPNRVLKTRNASSYADAHSRSLSLRLVLVGIKSKSSVLKLERVLRAFMRPRLNAIEKLRFDANEPMFTYES